MEVSGKSSIEINIESKEFEYTPIELINKTEKVTSMTTSVLPRDAINLNDSSQLEFYKNNKALKEAIKFIRRRRINKAINRPESFYLSLNDYVHKNRLCIPFDGINGDIDFYQTRTILDDKSDLPKYLGRLGSEKSVFGVSRVSADHDYIYIFEGPIDAMFVKNGVAVGGIDTTKLQNEILRTFPFHQKIWVLDNQHIDETANEASKKLINLGETIFIWPKGLEQFKDFNDICVYKKINEIPSKYILDNSFTGMKAKFEFKNRGL